MMYVIVCGDPRRPEFGQALDRPFRTAEEAHHAIDAMTDDGRRTLAEGGWRVRHRADVPRR